MRKIILRTLSRFRLLTAAVILTVAGAVIVSLLPPLVLERIINELTQNQPSLPHWVSNILACSRWPAC